MKNYLMRNLFKKIFIISMIFMHVNPAYSQENPDDLSNNIAALPIIIVSSIIVGSIVKIGQIYFEKYLNENYKVQITPAMPTIKVEETINFNFSGGWSPHPIKNNKQKKSTENATRICRNGLISDSWFYNDYKSWNNMSIVQSYIDYFYDDKMMREYKKHALETQQPQRLNKYLTQDQILPQVPKKFDTPEYSGRQRPSDQKDHINYVNYDLK